MMLTVKDYFGKWFDHKDADMQREANAVHLIGKVNDLLHEAMDAGLTLKINPKTQSIVAGETLGGFRPQDAPIGAPQSAHKQGMAVDLYDPDGKLDEWVTDALLTKHGLYREAPSATPTWCHLTTRAPKSGRRTFMP